jgi:adenine phosphoribosyltransferase
MTIDLKDKIRTIPDFPKKGIMFKDITPILQDPKAFNYVIDRFMDHYKGKPINAVACAESRGFIFGAMLAYKLSIPFIPLRKPGKLPYKTLRQDFTTEYSTDAFEVHIDAINKGDNVLIIDDLLATGGTAKASIDLIEKLGGVVSGIAFVIELSFLKGRGKLEGYDVFSLADYKEEA